MAATSSSSSSKAQQDLLPFASLSADLRTRLLDIAFSPACVRLGGDDERGILVRTEHVCSHYDPPDGCALRASKDEEALVEYINVRRRSSSAALSPVPLACSATTSSSSAGASSASSCTSSSSSSLDSSASTSVLQSASTLFTSSTSSTSSPFTEHANWEFVEDLAAHLFAEGRGERLRLLRSALVSDAVEHDLVPLLVCARRLEHVHLTDGGYRVGHLSKPLLTSLAVHSGTLRALASRHMFSPSLTRLSIPRASCERLQQVLSFTDAMFHATSNVSFLYYLRRFIWPEPLWRAAKEARIHCLGSSIAVAYHTQYLCPFPKVCPPCVPARKVIIVSVESLYFQPSALAAYPLIQSFVLDQVIRENPGTRRAAEIVAALAHAMALRHLRLNRFNGLSDMLPSLLRTLPLLCDLNLSSCGLNQRSGSEQFAAVLRSLPHLTCLNLGYNSLSFDQFHPVLTALTACPRLRVLNLNGNHLGTQVRSEWNLLENLSQLEEITAEWNHFSRASQMVFLASVGALTHLRTLLLSDCNTVCMGPTEFPQTFATVAPRLRGLQTLNLGAVDPLLEDPKVFCDGLAQIEYLQSLSMKIRLVATSEQATAPPLEPFADALSRLRFLQRLDLTSSHCTTFNLFAILVRAFEHLPRLDTLMLDYCSLNSGCVRLLRDALRTNRVLTRLHLRYNPDIDRQAVPHLVQLASEHPQLYEMSLSEASIPWPEFVPIARALPDLAPPTIKMWMRRLHLSSRRNAPNRDFVMFRFLVEPTLKNAPARFTAAGLHLGDEYAAQVRWDLLAEAQCKHVNLSHCALTTLPAGLATFRPRTLKLDNNCFPPELEQLIKDSRTATELLDQFFGASIFTKPARHA